eukprot:1367314-Rhodomonas_salina.5
MLCGVTGVDQACPLGGRDSNGRGEREVNQILDRTDRDVWGQRTKRQEPSREEEATSGGSWSGVTVCNNTCDAYVRGQGAARAMDISGVGLG